MKTFKKIISEVAQPKSGEEKKFKDQHEVDVVPHPQAGDEVFKGTKAAKPKAKRKADQEGEANYDKAYMESVEELDEISKKTLGSYVKKASDDMADNAYTLGARDPLRKPGSWNKAFKRRAGIAKATDRLTKEEVEQLDEIGDTAAGKKKLKNLIVNRTQKVADAGASLERRPEKAAEYDRAQKRHMKTIGRAATRLAKEEVEQLDELSPNTLHSYIKKAAGNMAGNAAVAAAQASSSMKKSSPDVKRNIKNRMRGITGASGRLADKANMAENWQEEIPMMMRQLEFIVYAAEEIMDYVEMAGDPEEWFQNKISGIHQSMLSMYAYAQGGRRAGYGFDESVELDEGIFSKKPKINIGKLHDLHAYHEKKSEAHASAQKKHDSNSRMADHHSEQGYEHENAAGHLHNASKAYDKGDHKAVAKHLDMYHKTSVARKGIKESIEEELKGGQKKLDHNKNGKIDAHDFHLMRKKKMKEEADLEEAAFAMDIDYNAEKRLAAAAKAAGLAIKFVQAGGATEMQLRGDKDKITKFLKARRVPASEISRGWFGEETELDEVTRSAVKRPVNITGPDGKTRTVYKSAKSVSRDEHGQEKIKTNESVEILDEAFKQGIVKLKDGGSVVLKKEDADLLNQMFKDLSSANRKKMQEVAMKDKAGFEEILGFAREAL